MNPVNVLEIVGLISEVDVEIIGEIDWEVKVVVEDDKIAVDV